MTTAGSDSDRQRLKELIDRFNFDPSGENKSALLEIVREVNPTGYGHLVKCRCAYEFHMILETLLDP